MTNQKEIVPLKERQHLADQAQLAREHGDEDESHLTTSKNQYHQIGHLINGIVGVRSLPVEIPAEDLRRQQDLAEAYRNSSFEHH